MRLKSQESRIRSMSLWVYRSIGLWVYKSIKLVIHRLEGRRKTKDTRERRGASSLESRVLGLESLIDLLTHRPIDLLRVLCFMSCISILGCYGTETIKIKVRVNSKVDMRKYSTIAVMDFINSRNDSPGDQGRTLARMVRKQLKNSKEFIILDERSMYMMLDEEIDKDKIEDPNALVSICNQMGVDALIVGTFDFYRLNQPTPYIVESYSPSTGRYRPETRTYIQRVYRFSLHAKVVDGTTGETIFDHIPPLEERPEFRSAWGLSLSESGSDSTSLRSIAARPVRAFVLSLIPHYEYEQRILAR